MQEEPELQPRMQQPTSCLQPGESLRRKPTKPSQPLTRRVRNTVNEYWVKPLSLCSFVPQQQRTIAAWKSSSKTFNLQCKSQLWEDAPLTTLPGTHTGTGDACLGQLSQSPRSSICLYSSATLTQQPWEKTRAFRGASPGHRPAASSSGSRKHDTVTPHLSACTPCRSNTTFPNFNMAGCYLFCLVFLQPSFIP